MHSPEKSYQKSLLLIISLALLYALLISLLHILIFAGFSAAPMDQNFWMRILMALPMHFLPAIPASWLYSRKGLSGRIPGALLYLLLIVFNVVAFYAESATGKYLHLSESSYLGELRHILPSIQDTGMFIWGALEILICLFVVLWAGRTLLIRIEKGAFFHFKLLLPGIAFLCACMILGGIALAAPGVFKMGIGGEEITPLVAVLTDLEKAPERPSGKKITISRAEIEALRRFLGNPEPLDRFSPQNPLCTGGRAGGGAAEGNGRSMIFLILEGIGRKQFEIQVDGFPLMPQLHRVAQENLHFENFFPSGEGSIQAMFPLFTGIIPGTAYKYIDLNFLPDIKGFPTVLREHGYRTSYFHGGNLGFEKQRVVLRRVGFKEIIEYDTNSKGKGYGWGYPDGEMFRRLRHWIETHRKNNGDAPYFSTLFTLSTHHPFTLPPGWEKSAQNPLIRGGIIDSHPNFGKKRKKLLKAMVYLDEELGVFYRWYKKYEMPKGTLLFIVSDHPMQVDGVSSRYSFQVPLIISGLGHEGQEIDASVVSRLAGHLDITATMAHVLGVPAAPCNQGVNILARPEAFPSDRLIYSVSLGLDKVYVWGNRRSWVFERKRGKVLLFPDSKSDRPVQYSPDSPDPREIRFLKLLLKINYRFVELVQSSVPDEGGRKGFSPAVSRARPIIVSHRGNTQGAPDDIVGNDMKSIEQAIDAGFQWIEVDVNITKDLVLVVVHDSVVRDAQGNEVLVSSLTLDALRRIPRMDKISTLEEILKRFGHRVRFLIELKPQANYYFESHLIHRTARLLKRLNMGQRVILDSFGRHIVSSMEEYSDCEVAYDAPFGVQISKGWLLGVRQMGLDWVYISKNQISADLIEAAHDLGLKVMVYTVNRPDVFLRIEKWGPDGIMTDYAGILETASEMDSGG